MIESYVSESILGKAREKGLLSVRAVDIRAFAEGKHRVTDDSPYGGGAGMVMKVEPIARAIRDSKQRLPNARTLLMSPRGRTPQSGARAQARGGPRAFIRPVAGGTRGSMSELWPMWTRRFQRGTSFSRAGSFRAPVRGGRAAARWVPQVLGNEPSRPRRPPKKACWSTPIIRNPRSSTGPRRAQRCSNQETMRASPVGGAWMALQLTQKRRPDLWAAFKPSETDLKLPKFPEDEL